MFNDLGNLGWGFTQTLDEPFDDLGTFVLDFATEQTDAASDLKLSYTHCCTLYVLHTHRSNQLPDIVIIADESRVDILACREAIQRGRDESIPSKGDAK